MKSFLKRLYQHGIHPAEEILPKDPAYWPTWDAIEAEWKVIAALLPGESSRIEELQNRYCEVLDMTCFAGFTYGLRFGILMTEDLRAQEKEPH